jgi:hypothetical protein
MFNQPQEQTGGLWFKPANHKGNLILFESVIEGGREFDQMANAEREYRVVSYIDLDGEGTVLQAKVSHKGIVQKLPLGATNILGRIEQVKTSNGYLAWVLSPFKPEDAAKAKAWIDAGRPSNVDPMAQLEREAESLGVTTEMLAAMKRLQAADKPQF